MIIRHEALNHVMRKFQDGILALLTADQAGDGGAGGASPASGAGGGAGGGAGAAAAGAGGGAEKPFAESLPEAIRNEAYFKDVKSLDDLATRAFHQSKMLGKVGDPNALAIVPHDPADADGWNKLYSRLGRPDNVDGYKLPSPGEGKDYSEADKAFQAKILPKLHEAGLTQRQLEAIVPAWNEIVGELNGAPAKAAEAAQAQAIEALKKDFGAAFEEKIDLANQALQHFGGDELVKELNVMGADGKRLGDMPQLVRTFAKLGELLKEDGVLGKGEGTPGALSPAEARQQIAALRANSDFQKRYTSTDKATRQAAVQELERLYNFAHPQAG